MKGLRHFAGDERGQISFVAVFATLLLVALVGVLATTADVSRQRVNTQQAVDASALAAATWVARGLNVVSAINVIQSQLIGGALALNALQSTLEASEVYVDTECEGFTACCAFPLTAIVCCPLAAITCAQAVVLPGLVSFLTSLTNTLSRCDKLMWQVAKALATVNGLVKNTFGWIGLLDGLEIAGELGVEGVAIPGSLVDGLVSFDVFSPGRGIPFVVPVEERAFKSLCQPMTVGTVGNTADSDQRGGYSSILGYAAGQGPFELAKCRMTLLADLVTGIPPLAEFLLRPLADAEKAQVCEGSDFEPIEREQERPARDLNECIRLGGTASWVPLSVRSSRVPADSYRDGCDWWKRTFPSMPRLDALPGDPRVEGVSLNQAGENRRACAAGPPGGSVVSDGVTCSEVGRVQVGGSVQYQDLLWLRQDMKVKQRVRVEESPLGSGSCPQNWGPYELRPDYSSTRALHFLAVGRPRGVPTDWLSREFLPRPQIVAYAQAEVYNTVSEDTYTQAWTVRLEEADLMRLGLQRLDGVMARLLSRVPELANWLSLERAVRDVTRH